MKKSLASEFPELAKEWDYKLNGDLKPSDVPPKGRQKVFWKCEKGHPSYLAKLAQRAYGTGCPYCNGSRVTFERSIAGKRPDLLSMWDYEKNKHRPDQVLAGSGTETYWICNQGHHFNTPAEQITRRKTSGCPYCRGLRVNAQNSLSTLYPTIASEWVECLNDSSLKPNDVTPGFSKNVQWKCRNGHEWKTTPKHRTTGGTGCPVCKSAYKISKQSYILYFYLSKYFSDIKMEFPLNDTRMLLDIYIPSTNLVIEYDGSLYHQDQKRDTIKDKKLLEKMPNCKIIRVREPKCPAYNSPNPNVVFYQLNTNSRKELQTCITKIFREQLKIKRSINLKHDNIPILELIDKKTFKNSLAAVKPELVKEWDIELNGSLKPEFFSYASHEEINWICDRGHRWSATIASRTVGGNNCPHCGSRRLNCENNLASVNPELVKEWHPNKNIKRPEDFFPNAHFKVWWLCQLCGHEWDAYIYNRNGNKSGCPNCYKQKYKKKYD